MADHKIHPHGLPEQLSDGVWIVKGSLAYPLHRNMVILRLPTGELLLHSVVALDDAGKMALDALGRPTWAIVPSASHMMDISLYKSRYPNLKVVAPAAILNAVEAKVPVVASVEDALPQFGFRLHEVPAARFPEYVYEFPLRTGGRMLIANDALGSRNTGDSSKFMGRLMTSLTGVPGNRLGIARIYRMAMTKDLAALRRFVAGLAEVPDLRLVTVSHGDPVTHDCAAALKAGAEG